MNAAKGLLPSSRFVCSLDTAENPGVVFSLNLVVCSDMVFAAQN